MATYRKMTYMVMDALKGSSDDFFFTEEHIIFLLDKVRAYLLLKKYNAQRLYATSVASPSPTEISLENYQDVCLGLEETDLLPDSCGGSGWLRSIQKVPSMLGIGATGAYPINSFLGERVTFIPPERMPFVGYNKWLKSIIYVAHNHDGHIYVHSANPQFIYLRNLRLHAIFENAQEASELACTEDGEKIECDILDREFPLEEELQMACIEYVAQELRGSEYAPLDKANNAEDDLAKASISQPAKTNKEER